MPFTYQRSGSPLRFQRYSAFVFFFQAEDGIRDDLVTGVQTVLFRSDRKSTRLNSSHQIISYAVFCLKKKMTALSIVVIVDIGVGCANECIGREPFNCQVEQCSVMSTHERNYM